MDSEIEDMLNIDLEYVRVKKSELMDILKSIPSILEENKKLKEQLKPVDLEEMLMEEEIDLSGIREILNKGELL